MDKQQMKGAFVLILVTAVLLTAFSFSTDHDLDDSSQTLSGTGKGYAGDIVVEVVLDGDEIKSITVEESDDTPGLSDDAFTRIAEAVLAEQTVDNVDIVSGATGSSNGMLEAIRAALDAGSSSGSSSYTGSGAGYAGEVVVKVTLDGNTITAIEVVESNDTPGLSDGAFEQIIGGVIENQSIEGVDIVSGATGSSNGILNAINEALAQQ